MYGCCDSLVWLNLVVNQTCAGIMLLVSSSGKLDLSREGKEGVKCQIAKGFWMMQFGQFLLIYDYRVFFVWALLLSFLVSRTWPGDICAS